MDSKNDEQTEILRNIWIDMKALNGRVDKTNEALGRTNEVITTEVRALGGRIDDLKDEVTAVKQEVRELRGEVAGVKQEVSGVKQEVRELRGDVDGVKQEVRELRGDVDGLKVEVTALRTATQSGFEVLARGDSRRDRDVHDLRDRVERIEEHVGLRPIP